LAVAIAALSAMNIVVPAGAPLSPAAGSTGQVGCED
jgi:hypothetical protein